MYVVFLLEMCDVWGGGLRWQWLMVTMQIHKVADFLTNLLAGHTRSCSPKSIAHSKEKKIFYDLAINSNYKNIKNWMSRFLMDDLHCFIVYKMRENGLKPSFVYKT